MKFQEPHAELEIYFVSLNVLDFVSRTVCVNYADENENYYQQLGSPNLSNPKKSTKKHYMSPTISAASKAISSRKNILVERNEASESVFSNTHIEKAHVDSLSQATPLTPQVSQSHDYDQNVLSNDSSSMPYDPVTNYLSPRPQFLRYKPNRRCELILGLGNSIAEGNNGLSLSRSGSFESQNAIDEEDGSVTTSSSLGSSDKQEDENVEEIDEKSEGSDGEIKGGDGEIKGSDAELIGIDEEIERGDEEIEGIEESDEEDEEVEEEKKGCNLKGVLKSLLVLVVLVLFTLHMASMNQETLFEGCEDGYCRGQNNTFEVDILKKLQSGSNPWDHREEGHMGLVAGIKGAMEIGIEEGKVVESVEHESGSEVMGLEEQIQMDFMEEHLTVIDEGVKEEMKVEDENLGALAHADEPSQVLASQAEEFEAVELIEGEDKRGVDGLDEVVVLQVEDIEEISDQMADSSELKDAETPENESFQHYQTTSISDEIDHHNLVSDASSAFEEEGKVAVEKIDEMVESKMEGLEYSSNMTAEPVMSEIMDDDNTGLDGEILDSGAEQNWRDELLNHMTCKTFYTAVVGVSIVSVIAASLALVFHFMQKKAINKDSSVIANTGSMKTLIIEQKKMIRKESVKYNSALADREEDGSIEQDVYSSFRRMSLSSNSKHSTEAGSEEYHSKAPTIELLGEFVVGEVSSSLRSCGLKNKMREGEEINYAVSSEKKLRSKVHSVSIQQQPSVSEFSYMGSFSHGSYTSEKKIKVSHFWLQKCCFNFQLLVAEMLFRFSL